MTQPRTGIHPELTDANWSRPYDQGRDFRPISTPELDKPLSFVKPTAPKTALDIGCGTSQLTRELYHRGYTIK